MFRSLSGQFLDTHMARLYAQALVNHAFLVIKI